MTEQQAKQFFKERGLESTRTSEGDSTGWRIRAKLAVQGTSTNPLIGLYKEGTHEVVDMSFCPDHHPKLNEAVERARAFIREKKIEPYQEKTGQGLLRYLQFTVERKTEKVQLVWVLNKTKEEDLVQWTPADADFWHSVWLNFNISRTNTILGSEWRLVTGPPLLWERVAGVDVCFHPASFMQVNLDLFEKLLHSLKTHVPSKAEIAEYYAGVGVIGLSLASHERTIRCCEVTPQAKLCFEEARKKLDPQKAARIQFCEGLAMDHLSLLDGSEIVIVDPPRKGLDRKLMNAIKNEKVLQKIIYISCGWESFKRDCDELLENGWVLRSAEIYLFFPGTKHLETLAVFEK